jgi:hypothetical protein
MSCAGLTRVSINPSEKRLSKGMDGRVKPGHDERKRSAAVRDDTHKTHAERLI